jgi:hypothetical protein
MVVTAGTPVAGVVLVADTGGGRGEVERGGGVSGELGGSGEGEGGGSSLGRGRRR